MFIITLIILFKTVLQKLSTIMSPNSGNSVNLNMDLLEAGLLSPSSTTANTPIKYVLYLST